MFIYTGKLNWGTSAYNELLVAVLPNTPVRVGDSIYTFSQWTSDAHKNKKVNFFQHQIIDKVTKADNGDDVFHFGAGYYSYQVQAQQGYHGLSITMSVSHAENSPRSNMVLGRLYQSTEEVSMATSARIWTGKLNWPKYAENEPFMVIVPEGFGAGKPLLAFWQWTVDEKGQAKVNCVRTGTQKAEGPAEGSLKFSLISDYTLVCTWDEKTEKLAVHMEGQATVPGQDIPLELGALIQFHSDDVNPPEFPGEKVELEVHYPRAEQALPRIQAPMPFPPTLVETLVHTASFVDRAGYLAKYAVDRYHSLDKSYHALLQQIDDLNAQIRDLSNKVVSLTGESDGEKKEIDNLQKQLADVLAAAAKKEADLTKLIQDLQKALAQDKAHDAEDHNALDAAHEQIRKDQEAQATLQRQIVALQLSLAQAAQRIQQFQAKITQQAQEIADLRGQLAAEKAHAAELQAQNTQLNAQVSVFQTEESALKKTLARTAEDLKQVQADSADKDKIIDGLEAGMMAIKKDRDAKKEAYEELKKSSSERIQELEDEIAQLKAGQIPTPGGGGDGCSWPFPDGWPFKNEGGSQGGCWPTPDELLKQMGPGNNSMFGGNMSQ